VSLLFLLEEKIETGIDGHSIYLLNILKELKKRKISFFVIYNKKNFYFSLLKKENFNVEIIDINSKNIKKILSPIHLFKVRKKIKKIILSNSIKHIHASTSNNLIFLSKKWGITISCNQHGAYEKRNFMFYLNFFKKHSYRNIIKSIISNFLLFNFKKASLIICSGKDAENTCIQSYRVSKKKIITLFNVANLDLTNLVNIKKDLKICNTKKIIIGIGRIQKDKGVEDFCKIAEMFSYDKNLKFIYVGSKTSAEYSNKIIKKYTHIVNFLGVRNDINNLLYSK
jgi:glycosyltransferase involved in cell wall biosynthesis